MRAAIPHLSVVAPLAVGGQVDRRGCSFLSACVGAALASPHAFLRGCTPQPLLQLACKWPSPFLSPFLKILA